MTITFPHQRQSLIPICCSSHPCCLWARSALFSSHSFSLVVVESVGSVVNLERSGGLSKGLSVNTQRRKEAFERQKRRRPEQSATTALSSTPMAIPRAPHTSSLSFGPYLHATTRALSARAAQTPPAAFSNADRSPSPRPPWSSSKLGRPLPSSDQLSDAEMQLPSVGKCNCRWPIRCAITFPIRIYRRKLYLRQSS